MALLLISTFAADLLHCGTSTASHPFHGPPQYSVKQATPFQNDASFVPMEPSHVGYLVFEIRGVHRQYGDIILSMAAHENTSLLTGCTLVTEAHDPLPAHTYILDFNLFFGTNFYCDDASEWPHCSNRTEFLMDLFTDPQLVFLKRAGTSDWVPINAVNISSQPVLQSHNDMFYHYNQNNEVWAVTHTQVANFTADQLYSFRLEVDMDGCVYPAEVNGFELGTINNITYYDVLNGQQQEISCDSASSTSLCSNFCLQTGVLYLISVSTPQQWTLVGPKFNGGGFNHIVDIETRNVPTLLSLRRGQSMQDFVLDKSSDVYMSAVSGNTRFFLRNPADINLQRMDMASMLISSSQETRLFIDAPSVTNEFYTAPYHGVTTKTILYGHINACGFVDDAGNAVDLSSLDAGGAFWSAGTECLDTLLQNTFSKKGLSAPTLKPHFYASGGLITGFFESVQTLQLAGTGRQQVKMSFDDIIEIGQDLCHRMVPSYPADVRLLNPDIQEMSEVCFGTSDPTPDTLRLDEISTAGSQSYSPCTFMQGTAFGHLDIVESLIRVQCAAVPLLLISSAAVCYTLLVQTWADVQESRGVNNAGRLAMRIFAERDFKTSIASLDDWRETFRVLDRYAKVDVWTDDDGVLQSNYDYCVALVGWEPFY